MKCIWKQKDGFEECPICRCTFITFDGIHMLCPSCAAREIKRLRQLVKRLTQRAADENKFPPGTTLPEFVIERNSRR